MNTAQMRHIEIMRNFLTELNKETDTFILKGGTSLLLAYGLDRFSEDIDLDGEKRRLKGFIESYSQKHGFSFRIAKDTPTVERFIEDLSESAKEQLKDALTYKGFDYFDYVTSTQDDALIDKDTLAGLYLKMFEKLDLLYSEEEAKTLSAKETDAEKEDDEQEEWSR